MNSRDMVKAISNEKTDYQDRSDELSSARLLTSFVPVTAALDRYIWFVCLKLICSS
jgi:hypothetical protein